MNDKFIQHYMGLAKFLSESKIECLSRGIGTVVVDPIKNAVVSTGVNGPGTGVPHPDSYEFLKEYVWPQLTDNDKYNVKYTSDVSAFERKTGTQILSKDFNSDVFASCYQDCGKCPRKLVGAASGERLNICACRHSESNAIVRAGRDLTGFYMFCWCGVPCEECAGDIIEAKISKVFCLAGDEAVAYQSFKSKWLFEKAGIELIRVKENNV